MSTRSTTHFRYSHEGQKHADAKIYRHWDGYPEGAGSDLYRFLREVKENLKDTRFTDPCYLAAKYVVWLSHRGDEGKHRLDFLGVGVIQNDPTDIEYRYYVDCDEKDARGFPKVSCFRVEWSTQDWASPEFQLLDGEEHTIPLPPEWEDVVTVT